MSKAAGVEEAVRSAVVLLVVDLRELQAAVLQQLRIMKLLVRQVNLLWDIRLFLIGCTLNVCLKRPTVPNPDVF